MWLATVPYPPSSGDLTMLAAMGQSSTSREEAETLGEWVFPSCVYMANVFLFYLAIGFSSSRFYFSHVCIHFALVILHSDTSHLGNAPTC